MRLIYSEKRNIKGFKKLNVLFFCHGFRSHIQHFCMSRNEIIFYNFLLAFIERAVQKMRHIIFTAVAAHEIYLVFHERNERRNYYSYPGTYHSRQLVAKAFSAAGWHYHKSIFPRKKVIYYFLLRIFKCIKAKVMLQVFIQIRKKKR